MRWFFRRTDAQEYCECVSFTGKDFTRITSLETIFHESYGSENPDDGTTVSGAKTVDRR